VGAAVVTDQPPPVSAEQALVANVLRYVREGIEEDGVVEMDANSAAILLGRVDALEAELQAAQEREKALQVGKHAAQRRLQAERLRRLCLGIRAEAAEEREKGLREVAHQIVGLSRTVEGEHPTVQAIAANASRALLGAQRAEEGG